MTTSESRLPAYVPHRRSQRVLLSVSIMVSGARRDGSSFSEPTRTLVVNAHGGLIQLREPVIKGQTLRIKNLATHEEVSCSVAGIDHESENVPEVGIACSKPSSSFWRVSFPPEDWTFRSPEAKHISGLATSAPPIAERK